ncbi:unnamed protein product [Musa acuminata subsp. burmannicoides]
MAVPSGGSAGWRWSGSGLINNSTLSGGWRSRVDSLAVNEGLSSCKNGLRQVVPGCDPSNEQDGTCGVGL